MYYYFTAMVSDPLLSSHTYVLPGFPWTDAHRALELRLRAIMHNKLLKTDVIMHFLTRDQERILER